MGELASSLFTEGDPATVKKLEDCATGSPNEVTSHFSQTENRSGEHIRRVQLALNHAQDVDPDLDLPEFEVNGVYDSRFAKAIEVYKERRGIKNYAGRIDSIVGIKTIRSLDNDARIRKQVDPDPRPHKETPVPRPTRPPIIPFCVTDAECPTGTDFEILLIIGGSGGEIAEAGFFTFLIRDVRNNLTCLYSMTSAGLGTPGLPITPSGAGKPSRFATPVPVKITRFGPVGGLTSLTEPGPGFPVNPLGKTLFSILTFGYRTQLTTLPDGMTTIHDFDTGPIPLVGAGGQLARFRCDQICDHGLGANKL